VSVVSLAINGKRYDIGCEDGAERQLEALAGVVDAKARQIAAHGAPSETRLMLLAALVLADELSNLTVRASAAETLAARLEADLTNLQSRAAEVIEGAVRRIEAIGADWE
jgi:cell division protein ZapA